MNAGGILLCAVDLDERAPALVRVARRWADSAGLRARFAHACPPSAVEESREALRRLGIADAELRIVAGEPAAALVAVVREERPAMVLVASRARDGGGGGSVCLALMEQGSRPVAVLPPGVDGAVGEGPVACAVSLGDEDEAAVRFASALAQSTARRLVLAHAVGATDAARLAAAQTTTRLRRGDAPPAGRRENGDDLAHRAGTLAARLLDTAREAGAGALVVAARTGAPVAETLPGSVARLLWTSAPCPVVVVDR